MEYLQKLKLSDTQYIAVLEKALVIVTTDKDGKPIRYAIFERKGVKI